MPTDETINSPATEKAAVEKSSEKQRAAEVPERVFLVPYPKVIFLYPTFICGLIAAIWMSFLDASEGKPPVVLAAVFLFTLAVNLIVLTLDFPRATGLTLFFVGATLALGVALIGIWNPNLIPFLADLVTKVRPVANATFYWLFTAIIGGVFVIVKIKIQFDYWEVRRNEILHHHGLLSDLRRYPTAGLQVNKEISDVFEYLLLRSGTLTLKPQGENRLFVLENVPRISAKEERLTKMLSAVKVKVQMES